MFAYDLSSADDPESVIVTAARRLDARHVPLAQVGIQFVQIGDDQRAADALRELDENLSRDYGIRVGARHVVGTCRI